MTITCSEEQIVGETESTLFSVLQQGPVGMLIIIKNTGVNTLNYRFAEFNGSIWSDLGAIGSDLNNTLQANEVKSFKVTSDFPQVRCVGNASGGSFLNFDVLRHFERPSGGSLPILSL